MNFTLATLCAFTLIATSCALNAKVDQESVRTTIKAHLDEVRLCYEEALKTDKSLVGKIVVDFAFDDQGVVTWAEVKEQSTTLLNRSLQACMITKLRGWKFSPAPPGTMPQITYPFIFENQNYKPEVKQ